MLGGIGPMELGLVAVLALLLLGPKRLPEAGRSLGQGIRGFRKALDGKTAGEDEPEQQPA
jgi:sec-independent protein translocase protein TatA